MATAVLADLDVDVENPFEALHPGHSAVPLCWTLVVPVRIGRFWWIGLLAALGRRDLNTVFAVRCKDPVESGEVDSWLGYQRGQFGNEIQRLKDHMGGAIPKALATLAGQAFAVRSFELVANLAVGG